MVITIMDESKIVNFYDSLPEYLQYFIMKADLMSPKEVLSEKDSTFEHLGASNKSIQQLKLEAAKFLQINIVSVSTLISDYADNWTEKLSFGCKSIDNCTNGGILKKGITEICGESGAGKTQIMLQLCLIVQLPHKYGGFSQNAAYISTEKMFPSKRLDQLLKHFELQYPQKNLKYLDGIYLKHIYDNTDLIKCIQGQLPHLIKMHNIGLIVIDSITAIYRTDSNYIKRAKDMRRIIHSLLILVEKFKCAVVCVNQVASVQNNVVPCLGLAWSNLVRTRLKVSKPENEMWCKNHRKFEIAYSPELPNRSCIFAINTEGVCET